MEGGLTLGTSYGFTVVKPVRDEQVEPGHECVNDAHALLDR